MDVAALLARAGAPAAPLERLHGGDVGAVFRAGDVVVKLTPRPGMAAAEARGLALLRAAGATTPDVHHVDDHGLVMAYLPPGPSDDGALAELLAALHATRVPQYGADQPVFLATFPLPGGTSARWPDVWVERRLRPLLRATAPTLGPALTRRVDAALCRPWPTEGPTIVHGDLWAGNVLHTTAGPALIDPAAFAGERLVDLAMMRLFGGFSTRFWHAYTALLPITPEIEAAIDRAQLYHLLVHVHLFGASYLSAVRGRADSC